MENCKMTWELLSLFNHHQCHQQCGPQPQFRLVQRQISAREHPLITIRALIIPIMTKGETFTQDYF